MPLGDNIAKRTNERTPTKPDPKASKNRAKGYGRLARNASNLQGELVRRRKRKGPDVVPDMLRAQAQGIVNMGTALVEAQAETLILLLRDPGLIRRILSEPRGFAQLVRLVGLRRAKALATGGKVAVGRRPPGQSAGSTTAIVTVFDADDRHVPATDAEESNHSIALDVTKTADAAITTAIESAVSTFSSILG